MKDTSPEVEQLMREMMSARSGSERMVMCARMADAARTLILASLPKDLPSSELKRKLFERLHGVSLDSFMDDSSSSSEVES